jgi:pimeloyl-ACP methyl ester carboxylesterase
MSSQPLVSQIAIGQGSSISLTEQGEGEAVMFLHGIGSGARSWRGQLEAFSDHARAMAWDAPGYGSSTCLSKPAPDVEDYADALEGLLREKSIHKLHLVGHSLGALIATSYAKKHPARLRSLTLASIAPGHGKLSEDERIRLRDRRLDALDQLGARAMAETRGPHLLTGNATPDMRQAVVEVMASINPKGYRQAVLMLSKADTASELRGVAPQIPVQIVFGGEDTITPPASNMRTAQARPDAPVHVISGAGHAVYIEKAAEFDEVLRAFMAQHSCPRAG